LIIGIEVWNMPHFYSKNCENKIGKWQEVSTL
jgi:hypothetical protein